MSSLKKKTMVAYAWSMGGKFLKQGSSFIVGIFLARLLAPEQFGLIGMSMVFISISQVFVDVGFTSALIQRNDNNDVRYSSIFWINCGMGLLLALTFFLISDIVGSFYDEPKVSIIIKWMSLSFIFGSLNIIQVVILKKDLNFKVISMRTFVGSVTGGVVGVVMAYMDYGVYSLVAQNLISAFIGTVILWKATSWRPSLTYDHNEVKALFGFSAYQFFNKFVNTIIYKLDVFIIAKVFSPADLGFYSRAKGLRERVKTYSTKSVASIFFPVLSQIKDDKKTFYRVFDKAFTVIMTFAFSLSGIMYVLGEEIIIGLYGDKWQPSVPIFQMLILMLFSYPISALIVNAFLSQGMAKQNFYLGLIRKFFQFIPLVVAFYSTIFNFTLALVIVSYSMLIFNIVMGYKFVNLNMKKLGRYFLISFWPLAILITLFETLQIDELHIKLIMAAGFIFCIIISHYYFKSYAYEFMKDNLIKLINRIKKK